jgi:hypothetical protein
MVLQQDTKSAAANGIEMRFWIAKAGQNEHARLPGNRVQIWKHVEAVVARHIEIEQHDVGLLARRQSDHRIDVAGLADDVQVRLLLDEHTESGTYHRMIIRNQNPDRCHRRISGGHFPPALVEASPSGGGRE